MTLVFIIYYLCRIYLEKQQQQKEKDKDKEKRFLIKKK